MSVVAIRLYHLSAPLFETIGNALVFFDRRETLLVELVDDAGLSGWGEAWSAPAAAAAVIAGPLSRCVLGQAATPPGRLWHRMVAASTPDAVSRMAVAALDMAAHDLAARLAGVPVSALLGGALRDRVFAYASGPFFRPNGHPYREYERDAEGYLRAGFRAIKLRIGLSPREDAAVAVAIRRLIGPEAPLMVDFNQSCLPRAALETARRLEAAEPLWLEEPTVPEDLAGYRLLSGRVIPALAGGETYAHAALFQPFLVDACLDVLQPDLAVCGGFSGVARVAALAELAGRPLVPHVWGSTVNLHAALHLVATLPALRGGAAEPFPFLEVDVGPNPLLELAGRPAVGADGTIAVPQGAGLGIELTPAMLAPFLVRQQTVAAE